MLFFCAHDSAQDSAHEYENQHQVCTKSALSQHQVGKALAQKIKELIDVQSSFTDWLNNSNVRADLNQKLFFCLVKAGYPPQFNDEVFDQVMEQVEHFKRNN